MIFNERGPYTYASAMDSEYLPNSSLLGVPLYGDSLAAPIDGPKKDPILTVGELGQTVGEGRGSGSFIESVQAAIRQGGSHIELSLSASGSEPNVGPDLYGKEKRREIREIARANQINIASVHTPVQVVANMSGFAGEQRGFLDDHRHIQVTEVKKAIQFAADTTDGAAVIVHTGEFQRPFTEQSWARTKYGEFKHYDEEPQRFIVHVVDQRTGRVMSEARKNQVVYEPKYKTAEMLKVTGNRDAQGHVLQAHDWVDMQGNWINPEDPDRMFERVPEWNNDYTRFETIRLTWDDFVQRAKQYNERNMQKIQQGQLEPITPEEAFTKTQLLTNALRSRGGSLFHGRFYAEERRDHDEAVKALKYFEEIEKNVPPEEQWRLLKEGHKTRRIGYPSAEMIGREYKLPSQWLKEAVEQQKNAMRYSHEASAASDAEADRMIEDMHNIVSASKYAKRKTADSYADAGIYAMDTTKDRNLPRPLFLAPENIFPEMGYGSHPEELIELVQTARKKMAERLATERHWTMDKAQKAAETHIRATLDTEHLGMWKKHFVKNPGETEDQFNSRFNSWYMDQVKKMQEAGVVGHLHIADGFGFGHGNLPVGHGNTPVVEAVEYLKKKGYKGAFLSEGYGDAPRMLRDAWRAFGSPIYSVGGPMRAGGPTRWNNVSFAYFGQAEFPHYIFGAYAPSNDWTLWSQVPME